MLDGARYLLHATGRAEQVHLVVFFPDFVRHTARPGFDLVESEFLFVVPRLAHVHIFAWRKASRPTFVEARDEHDEAAIQEVTNLVVAVLPRLDHLAFEKVLLVSVDRLFWSVVPASIDPLLPSTVLPSPEYLCHDGLGQVVGIANVDPIPLNAASLAYRLDISLIRRQMVDHDLPTFQVCPLCWTSARGNFPSSSLKSSSGLLFSC